jgi:hypothetical protein
MILQPVFYVHLDPGCIPEKSTPDATTNIELARWSFVGLITICDKMIVDGSGTEPELRRYVFSAWPNCVAPWIAFFHSQFIMCRANYRPIEKKLAIRLVASMLHHGASLSLSDHDGYTWLSTMPCLYRMIAELWLIAIKTKNEHVLHIARGLQENSRADRVTPLRVVTAIWVAECIEVQLFATTILEVAGGIVTVTSTALKYVKSIRSMAQDPDIPRRMLVTVLSCCVEFISKTSEYSITIREDYILRKSVKEIFSTLRVIQLLLHATGSMDRVLVPAFGTVLHYFLTMFTKADDTVSVFYQALSSQALAAAACIDLSIPLHHGVQINNWLIIFLGILSDYTVYDKILTYALRHLDVWSSALDPITRQDETVRECWHMTKQYIQIYSSVRLRGEMMTQPLSNEKGWRLRVSHRYRRYAVLTSLLTETVSMCHR